MSTFPNPIPPKEGFTADDYLILPKLGQLTSRKHAQVDPFIFSAPMDRVTGPDLAKVMLALGEFPVVSRFIGDELYRLCLDSFGNLPNCWFATGSCPDEIKRRLEWALEAHPDGYFNFAIDIAHGDSRSGLGAIKLLAEHPQVDGIMSGSIATGPAAKRASNAGATWVRVGIGNGSACSTRINTGVGVPQMTAIQWVYEFLATVDNPAKIVADGGIRAPGDATKYMAAGADAVMLGSALSRARESHGWTEQVIEPDWSKPQVFPMEPDYQLVKTYRGQASAAFQKDVKGTANRCPEGASSTPFVWDGHTTTESVIEMYRGGLSSAISYMGLTCSSEINPQNVDLIKISASTQQMNRPYGV